MHLHDSDPTALEMFNKVMPDVGFDWVKTVGSAGFVLISTPVYAGQFEALAARWAVGDTSRLQTVMAAPCWYALAFLATMLRKKAGQSEMDLLGRSGSSAAAEGKSSMESTFAAAGSRAAPGET
jgi:hypothetical protein